MPKSLYDTHIHEVMVVVFRAARQVSNRNMSRAWTIMIPCAQVSDRELNTLTWTENYNKSQALSWPDVFRNIVILNVFEKISCNKVII